MDFGFLAAKKIVLCLKEIVIKKTSVPRLFSAKSVFFCFYNFKNVFLRDNSMKRN